MSGDIVRQAAVAGLFYPDDPCAIEADLAGLIAPADELLDARALVVPHASWMYSGRVAGAVYGRVRLIAVILGPNHTGVGSWGSIMTRGWWDLPGGALPIAREVAEAIRSPPVSSRTTKRPTVGSTPSRSSFHSCGACAVMWLSSPSH